MTGVPRARTVVGRAHRGGERRAVIVSVVVMLDNGYYYASHFLESDTDQGLRLHRQSMQLHAQALDDLVDHVVTEALSMLRRVQS